MKSSSASALLALATLIFTTTQGAKAGSYSPLDPYADVQAITKQPKAPKVKVKPEPRVKHVKDPSPAPEASFNNQPEPEQRSDSQRTESKPAKIKTAKVRTAKVKTAKLVPAKAEKPPRQVAEKPAKAEGASSSEENDSGKTAQSGGFVSGLKEIQQGYMHTFKAAGSGILHSTKKAGAKVADGTKKVSDGVSEGTKNSGGFFSRTKDALSRKPKQDDGAPKGEASDNAQSQPEAVAENKPVKQPKAPKKPKVAKEPKAPKEPKVAKAPKEPKAPKVAKSPKPPKEEKIASLEKPSRKLKLPGFGFGKGKSKEGTQLASRAVSPPQPSEIITPEEAIAHPEKFETLGKPLPPLDPIKDTKPRSLAPKKAWNPFSKSAKAPKVQLPQARAAAADQANGSFTN
jgi:hypothetical protein